MGKRCLPPEWRLELARITQYLKEPTLAALLLGGCVVSCSVNLQKPAATTQRTSSQCETVRAELDVASAALKKGSRQDAETQIQELVFRAPECARARLLLAMLLREKNKLTRGLEEAKEAARLTGSDPLTLNVLGDIYMAIAVRALTPRDSLEHLVLAKTAYESALRSTDSTRVKFSSGVGLLGVYTEQERVLRRLGKHTEADLLHNEIETFLKTNPQAREALDSFELRRATATPIRVHDELHPEPSERANRLRHLLEISE